MWFLRRMAVPIPGRLQIPEPDRARKIRQNKCTEVHKNLQLKIKMCTFEGNLNFTEKKCVLICVFHVLSRLSKFQLCTYSIFICALFTFNENNCTRLNFKPKKSAQNVVLVLSIVQCVLQVTEHCCALRAL